MRVTNGLLSARSGPEFYDLEKSSEKPNTGRLVDSKMLRRVKKATEIIITKTDESDSFRRKITNVSVVGKLFGYTVIIISWAVPELEEPWCVEEG